MHLPPVEGRLIQTFMYVRSSTCDNHYAHPIDFTPVVDLNLCKARHQSCERFHHVPSTLLGDVQRSAVACVGVLCDGLWGHS